MGKILGYFALASIVYLTYSQLKKTKGAKTPTLKK